MGFLEVLVLGIRAVQFVFAIIVLGLTGHLASYAYTWSQNNFLLFVAIWTILVVLYVSLSPKFFPSLAHIFAILALDALTMLFWFAGFIAVAVLRRNFGRTFVGYYYSFSGCDDNDRYCGEVAAAAAFGGFEWLLFLATTVLAAIEGMRQRRGKSSGGPVAGTA